MVSTWWNGNNGSPIYIILVSEAWRNHERYLVAAVEGGLYWISEPPLSSSRSSSSSSSSSSSDSLSSASSFLFAGDARATGWRDGQSTSARFGPRLTGLAWD